MKDIVLGPRLEAVAKLVRNGKRVADIGTDHAYLVSHLVLNQTVTFGYACDINPNPLKKARATVENNNLTNAIQLVLCDGLEGLSADQVDDVVIAGMGGETIVSILDACPWSADREKHYILQPMTKAGFLRKYLCENGYTIDDEIAVLDSGRVYTAMSVYYTGNFFSPDDLFLEIGCHSLKKTSASADYIQNRANAVLKKAQGLANKDLEVAKPVFELYDRILECL